MLLHGVTETNYKDGVNNASKEKPPLLLLIPSLYLLPEIYYLQGPFIEVTYGA